MYFLPIRYLYHPHPTRKQHKHEFNKRSAQYSTNSFIDINKCSTKILEICTFALTNYRITRYDDQTSGQGAKVISILHKDFSHFLSLWPKPQYLPQTRKQQFLNKTQLKKTTTTATTKKIKKINNINKPPPIQQEQHLQYVLKHPRH